MLFQLNVIPCTDDRSIVTYVLQMGRSEAMLEGKAVNASQVLNYYKHMVMICQEAMAGIHSLKSCKLLFASGHDFLIAENVKNKHTLLLPVLQQKLTSQLLKQHCKKGRG
nr:hypothetical protein CFP56_40297 [Quercus suber]